MSGLVSDYLSDPNTEMEFKMIMHLLITIKTIIVRYENIFKEEPESKTIKRIRKVLVKINYCIIVLSRKDDSSRRKLEDVTDCILANSLDLCRRVPSDINQNEYHSDSRNHCDSDTSVHSQQKRTFSDSVMKDRRIMRHELKKLKSLVKELHTYF